MPKNQNNHSYYKVRFQLDDEEYQVCARTVESSTLYGLIELGDFIFPESGVLYNPGEERVRREFEGVRRTWIPYHAVIRIDEVPDEREREIKVVPLDAARRSPNAPDKRDG